MSTSFSHLPAGYHSVTPSLTIKGAAEALTFYKKAFGAEETHRFSAPDGKVMHAEFKIGNSILMMSDEFPEWNALSPKSVGGCPSSLLIYVPDVDASLKQAVQAGAQETMPAADQFWGDRMGGVVDPFGYKWTLATRKEEVPEKEVAQRFEKWMKDTGGKGCAPKKDK